jgi:hypothetical protein
VGVTPGIDILDRSQSSFQFDDISETENSAGEKVLHTIVLTTKSSPPTGNLTVNWNLEEYIPQPGPWSLVWTPSGTKP